MTQSPGGVIDDAGLKTKRGWDDVIVNAMSLDTAGQSLAVGTNPLATAAVDASEQNGIKFTTLDEVYGRWHPPWYADLSHDIQAQLFVLFEEADKANVDFTLHAKGVAAGELESDCKVSADGSLVFPALASSGVGEVVKTPIMGLGLPGTFSLDEWIQFAITCADIGTATADKVFAVKARFFFTVALTDASGVRQTT